MRYERRYIQFNDLVFDGYDMISDADGDVSFKGTSTEYSYGHGSYRPFKTNYLYMSERNVSMTITLHMKKLPCEFRPFYNRFVIEQLSKPGKLWSIKDNQLLWANAVLDSLSEDYSNRDDTLVYDLNFVIPGGVWHKADKQKTFLVPWDICNFMDCMGYKTIDPCCHDDGCDSCTDKQIADNKDCSCCCDDELTADMLLCNHADLQSWYGCDVQYRVVYDCEHGQKFAHNKFTGQRLCVEDVCDSAVISGLLYSETEVPTEDIDIVISGKMKNPWITINDNTNIIKGEYDGNLIVKGNGDVYYQKDECCEPTLLDPSVWIVPAGNEYGWTIYPQNNKVMIYLNECCGASCAYISHDAITM